MSINIHCRKITRLTNRTQLIKLKKNILKLVWKMKSNEMQTEKDLKNTFEKLAEESTEL